MFLFFLIAVSGKLFKPCVTDKQLSGTYRTLHAEHQFWLFEARNNTQHAPLILWINGVPNQPPIFGTSAGMSPCRIENGTATHNVFAWNQNAHVVFFDMYRIAPGNKMFTGRYQILLDFVLSFSKKYPVYFKNGLHIFGQSSDAIAAAVVGNMLIKYDGQKTTKLLSVGLGSPIIDMRTQMKGYPRMMELAEKGTQATVAMEERIATLFASTKNCTTCNKDLHCKERVVELSEVAYQPYLTFFPSLINYKSTSYIDINQHIIDSQSYMLSSSQTLPSSFRRVDLLSNTLFVPSKDTIFDSYASEISTLLRSNIHVLLFSGELDYFSNFHGVRTLVDAMQWMDTPLNAVPNKITLHPLHSYPILVKRLNSKLTQAIVKQAGHLSQLDQPEYTQILVNDWISQFSPHTN
ncbi:hypothetical protein DSO57_1007296 [Entomophthora muscae]|uniref:Uncharacterized protein n=1 Tax=Entomophthora muscae TaxID=34485 RepID=A0ACC2RME8_9FUNG|nr:hypothetical protein DSO57_1007296 [Entomophthora muscae]